MLVKDIQLIYEGREITLGASYYLKDWANFLADIGLEHTVSNILEYKHSRNDHFVFIRTIYGHAKLVNINELMILPLAKVQQIIYKRAKC